MRALAGILALCTFAAGAPAANYTMEGGDLRHSNRAQSPSSIQGPLAVSWTAAMSSSWDGDVLNHPLILPDMIVQTFSGAAVAVDRSTGAARWRQTLPQGASTGTYDPSRGLLYFLSERGTLTALRTSDGSVAWTYSEGWVSGTVSYGGVVFAQDRLFFSTGGYGYIALHPDTRAVLWRCTLLTNGITTAAYDQGKLFVAAASGKLVSIDATVGTPLWYLATGKTYHSAVTLNDDTLFVMIDTGRVEARRRSDGALKWSFPTTSFGYSNLAICGRFVIIATDDRQVRAVDVETGVQHWMHSTAGNFAHCAPIVVCDTIYISGCGSEFYGLDGASGSIVWTLPHGVADSFVDWAEADGKLYVCDGAGKLYCFGAADPIDPGECRCDLGELTPLPTVTPQPSPGPCEVIPSGDLALWLSSEAGVEKDASGYVTRWLDQSGKRRHATSADLWRPRYVASAPAGSPALQFFGVMGLSNSESMINSQNDYTVIVKAQYTTGDYDQVVLGNGFSFWGRRLANLPDFTACLFPMAGVSVDFASTRVVSYVSGPSGAFVYEDGILRGSTGALCANFEGPYYVGRNGLNAGTHFGGYLYDLLVYDKALGVPERERIERCLLGLPEPTATITSTFSATATVTATSTPSASPTCSPSETETATETLTVTATETFSPSPTAAPTATVTLTALPTQVVPPTPVPFPTERLKDCGDDLIDRLVVSPNPQFAAADRMVSLKLGCGADEVVIEIYSASGTLLFRWVDTGKHVERGQWVHEKYPHDVELPNGTYFVRATVRLGDHWDNATTTFVVLK